MKDSKGRPIDYRCCFVAVLEVWGFYGFLFVSDQLRVQEKHPTQLYFDTEPGVML